jgi:hypothetical protein
VVELASLGFDLARLNYCFPKPELDSIELLAIMLKIIDFTDPKNRFRVLTTDDDYLEPPPGMSTVIVFVAVVSSYLHLRAL